MEFFFGCSFLGCFLFGVHDQARLGLDVLPAHATWGSGGVTSDWLCMWWDGALDPGINIVASLCADVRFFGLAQRMEPWLLDFCFCSALTGVVRWSVRDSLVRGVWCSLRWLPRTYVGAVGGALSRHGGL